MTAASARALPRTAAATPAAGISRRNHGRWHSYRVDGAKVPGVTTITGYFKSGALAEYPGKATREYAVNHWGELSALGPADRLKALSEAQWADRDAAANRGTEVHRIGAALASGAEVEVPEPLAAHVDSYLDFLDRAEPRIAAPPELLVGNRTERYCGTADLLADLGPVPWDGAVIPPGRWLLDLKTSRSGIFGETALQLCGYEHAEVFIGEEGDERPVEWLGIEHCGAVHIRRDGWDLYPCETGDEVWEHFVYLARLWHQQEAKKDWVGVAAGPWPDPAAASDSS
jgi:hypothetical protein